MKKIKFKNPSAYFTIMVLIAIAVLATWFIPSGQYERIIDAETGREIVNPESFEFIEDTPIGIFGAMEAIPRGIVSAAGIIAFIFIVSGSVEIVKETGAIDAGIRKLVRLFNGKDLPLLIGTMVIFSFTGTLLGFAQEVIPFIALGCAMSTSLGYDRVVGFHIVRTSTWIGFAASTINPYVLAVPQQMAGLPQLSGLGYRIVCYVVFMVIFGTFTIRYALKVKKDPTQSILYGYESVMDIKPVNVTEEEGSFTGRHKLVLLVFLLGLLAVVYGATKFEWGTNQMSAMLFLSAIICGFIGKIGPNAMASTFSKGMEMVTGGALIAGFTGAIAIILADGQILDTIIYGLVKPLSSVSGIVTVIGIFVIYALITFFIGSSAGRAAATMPIFIPLCDILGISRQTLVLISSLGAGVTNMFWPNMIYVLAFADIPYDRWLKHIWKLVGALLVAGAVLVSIAYVMNYGPF
ncbi:Na+/H+ antiporter NhaC family protein [Anaerovoracaceae bacterium 42-11]